MSLNKSKGNMYDFVTHTWNTVKGECPHGCTYCYMKRWGNQKPIRFDDKELKTDLGTGNFIFVGSSCDLFADNIPEAWIYTTLDHCLKFDNQYLFQTKNPARLNLFELPQNSVICTTIETNRFYPEIMKSSPHPVERSQKISINSYPVYVTIEPVLDFDLDEMIVLIRNCDPVQVNIGADSKGNGMPEPSSQKLTELIKVLETFTNVNIKSNLYRLLK